MPLFHGQGQHTADRRGTGKQSQVEGRSRSFGERLIPANLICFQGERHCQVECLYVLFVRGHFESFFGQPESFDEVDFLSGQLFFDDSLSCIVPDPDGFGFRFRFVFLVEVQCRIFQDELCFVAIELVCFAGVFTQDFSQRQSGCDLDALRLALRKRRVPEIQGVGGTRQVSQYVCCDLADLFLRGTQGGDQWLYDRFSELGQGEGQLVVPGRVFALAQLFEDRGRDDFSC